MVFMDGLMASPTWVQVWVGWLGAVNLAALFFLRDRRARWVLIAFACAALAMPALAEINGYNRLLGLVHIVFWTPLLIYLYRIRASIDLHAPVGRWLTALAASNAASLAIDFVDVARYASGDGALG